jgi:methylated-DNA-[protein]-cysteine S-methyltransferase
MNTFTSCLQSPLGPLSIISSSTHILEISFSPNTRQTGTYEALPSIHNSCIRQLEQYFSGNLKSFDLALRPSGTSFQQKVWHALMEIPHGCTISYQKLAHKLGDPKAVRAVAAANGKNKIPVIIPCHRVIGSDGSMVGFAGGLENKEWLLRHEGAITQFPLFSV